MTDPPKSYSFDLARITDVQSREFDLVMSIKTQEGDEYLIYFEGLVRIDDGKAHKEWTYDKKCSVELVDRRVLEILVMDSGQIRVSLEDGLIESDAMERYESWTLFTPGHHIVCLPGGALAVFSR